MSQSSTAAAVTRLSSSSRRCVDCEARLGGAGARNGTAAGQQGAGAVEYSISERGPACSAGFGCRKEEAVKKVTANGLKVRPNESNTKRKLLGDLQTCH